MPKFRGQYLRKPEDYCQCKEVTNVTTEVEDELGYWDVCCKCDKPLEDGWHYFDHYDGEDHDDNTWD